jgi:uncharacterized LabA/DUF88 family protein
VLVDWANVYGWRKSLKSEPDPQKIYSYFRTYFQVKEIRIYYGQDDHPKSGAFLTRLTRIGYEVISKPVKYITTAGGLMRKCDFDLEIAVDVMKYLHNGRFQTFVFLSGDGDFAALYRELAVAGKKVIVVYAAKHLGREIYEMHGKIYKRAINTIPGLL